MILILAETDPLFLKSLQIRLQKSLVGIRILTGQTLPEINAFLSQNDWQACLILYNQAVFPDLTDRLPSIDNRLMDCWPIVDANPDVGSQIGKMMAQTVFRFGKITDLVRMIQVWQKDWQNRQQLKPVFNRENKKPSAAKLHLLFCAKPSGYQPAVSRKRLKEMMDIGLRVVYLPLMPTFQMSCLSPPGQGPTLSDLLLQLLGRNIGPDQLSLYWQPNPEGYLQFRPPDRSDDLILCSPDILRLIINLLRDRLNQDNEPGQALIDCAGLPLSTISSLAVLCDCCEVLLPERACFATDAARRETSQVLANLPASCKILENHLD